MHIPYFAKSVLRRFGRYGFLALMIGFGIAAAIIVQAVTLGMSTNVTNGAARFIGGRYVVISRKGTTGNENYIENTDRVLTAIKRAGLEPRITVERTYAVSSEQEVFFNGDSLRLRRVCGVDFGAERQVFEDFSYLSGGIAGMTKAGTGILVSRQIAERFGARVGDTVTLQIRNRKGFLDTRQFSVSGVFQDASIFGYYTCYVDRETLRTMLGDPAGSCEALGFYFDGKERIADMSARLNAALQADGFESFPGVRNRRDFDAMGLYQGTRTMVFPVENYIDTKVSELIAAIQIVSYLFLGMVLVIILVGIRNTTQIMVRRRTREIGTARALGMRRFKAVRMILGESLLVSTIGFWAGLMGAIVCLILMQWIPLSLSDGFDIFLKSGHLGWRISALPLAITYLALALVTVTGGFSAALRAARISPASAIARPE